MNPVRVLGIDPGSRCMGYGVVAFAGAKSRRLCSATCKLTGTSLAERLDAIFQVISEVVAAHQPQEVAMEKVFMHRNADSALKLGHARGAAILGATRTGLPLFEYTPNQIKQAITGRGHAGKEQVQHMVKVLLNLDAQPGNDEADALAVAICHCHVRQTHQRLASARNTAGGPR